MSNHESLTYDKIKELYGPRADGMPSWMLNVLDLSPTVVCRMLQGVGFSRNKALKWYDRIRDAQMEIIQGRRKKNTHHGLV